MATAEFETEKVEKTIIEEKTTGVVLHLTLEEAEVIKALTGACDGKHNTRRRFAQSVFFALHHLGTKHKSIFLDTNINAPITFL